MYSQTAKLRGSSKRTLWSAGGVAGNEDARTAQARIFPTLHLSHRIGLQCVDRINAHKFEWGWL
jgi:hypothetical protein